MMKKDDDVNKVTIRRTNFSAFMDQFIAGYETHPAKGLVHGFQKDSIQNSWGHRIKDNGENWKMIFRYLENEKGNFIIVEDQGATGLTGKNLSQTEIQEVMDNEKPIGPAEKLARFQSLYNSGQNTTSAGLYGRGKLIYQAASKQLEYYFDTLREDGKYYSNHIKKVEIRERAYENEDAIRFIKNKTGLPEKTTPGTRVIITEPKDLIVEAIKSGKIIDYINETWWLIFKKYDAIVEVYDNNELIAKGQIPQLYSEYIMGDKNYKEYKNIVEGVDYRIKRLGLFYTEEDVESDLMNISYYRSDMKIGEVYELFNLPIEEKYQKKLGGYIELDSFWENELKENENLEHYGPKSRRLKDFQYMKNVLNQKIDNFAIEKGLKKELRERTEIEQLNELASDLTDFLQDSNINLDLTPSIGNKDHDILNVEIVKEYPNEEKRTLEYGQKMKFKYIIKNKTFHEKFKIRIKISNSVNDYKIIKEEIIQFSLNQFESEYIEIEYDHCFLDDRNVVGVNCVALDDNDVIAQAYFPIFVNINEEVSFKDFDLQILSFEMPHEPNRSIYLDEEIKDIKVAISNNTNSDTIASLNVLTQDVNDRNNTIESVYHNKNIFIKGNEKIILDIGKIVFSGEYINRKGPIRIRFRLSHIEGIAGFEKGFIILQPGIIVFFNTEEIMKNLSIFNISTNELGDIYLKSKYESRNDGGYELVFNYNFPLWKRISGNTNSAEFEMYVIDEMIRTIFKIQFQKANYSFTGKVEEQINELSVGELNDLIDKKINEYLGKYFEMRR